MTRADSPAKPEERATRSGVRVESLPLAGSPLAALAIDGRAPDPWYDPMPRAAGAWRARIEATRAKGAASMISALTPALRGHGLAARRLAAVVSGGGVVVTTGQQPGLFGGPLYTLAKAVTAAVLADVLQGTSGVPVAPIFWAATDDADAAEASRVAIVGRDGAEMLEAPPPAAPPGTPLSRAPLGDVSALLERLATAAGSASAADIVDVARAAYHPGATVGGAYLELLTHLLSPLGVTVLDAAHPIVRARMAPVTDAALAAAEGVAIALAARGDELRRAGHPPQVAELPELTLVFDWSTGTKARIPLARASEARRLAPEMRSPNVLLRPIAEQAILPTVTYVAGPGELAYFAQVSATADALGTARPVAVPRWSGLVVEPRISRILEKLALDRDAVLDFHRGARLIAERSLSGDARRAIDRARARADETGAELQRLAAAEPRSLPEGAARGHGARFRHAADRLERRMLAAAKRRETEALTMLAVASGSLRPFGRPQERTLAFLPLVARYGSELVDAMCVAAREHGTALVGS